MPENTLIRKATKEEMLNMWGYADRNSAGPTACFFCENLDKKNAVFWTVEINGEPIGELYVFYELEDRDFADGKEKAYLCAFRIRKEYRHQGYGTRLMERVLKDLKEQGYAYATIGVNSDEEANIRLYRHFGFSRKIKDCHYDPCDRDENMQPLYQKEAWWLLEKTL